MRFRRALAWPLAVTAALAPAAAGHAQSTTPDDGRGGWMLGLGAQVDENEAHSLLGTSYIAAGARTWLTFSAGESSSPGDGGDIEANAVLIGVDHRLDKVGFTLEAEQWGDSGVLETTDLAGSVYFDRPRWRIGFGYERRDIEIPFTVTGPFGGVFQRSVDVQADGFSLNASLSLAERWRLSAGLKEYDYDRNLNALPRIASLNWLSTSTLTLANSFLDHDRWINVERRFGQATLLNARAATDASAIDGAELETLEVAVLFPIGRRIDLEVNLGSGRSSFFDAGVYGGLLFLIYGR
jgi:hypothetical protein